MIEAKPKGSGTVSGFAHDVLETAHLNELFPEGLHYALIHLPGCKGRIAHLHGDIRNVYIWDEGDGEKFQ